MARDHILQVRLTDEELGVLNKIALAKKISRQEIVREYIKDLERKQEKEKEKQEKKRV